MISVVQAIIIGLAQGLTELFPISSLGHSVILPSLLGWHINQDAPYYLTFLVATHAATAAVLFVFFWQDWMKIIRGLLRSIIARRLEPGDTYARLGWLLVIGTVPAGLLGLLLQHTLQAAFASAQIAAAFLIINGLVLFAAERLRKRQNTGTVTARRSDRRLSGLQWRQAAGIGLAQAAALIPGISRSGSSMAGGLFAGLNNEDAARFSFLLATPVIGAAALLKLPHLFSPSMASMRGAILAGAFCAGLAAYLSVRFLVRYFQTQTLKLFAVYCTIAGVLFSIIFLFR
ncbi:MAG TPA: undecaprenyl-diphosphate phosphatase [Candidatus Saccharimonadales bacterium]|nr:undecaprenyl-diphosphate phosphatase [Candidatus Saccharimonadales bacterium]